MVIKWFVPLDRLFGPVTRLELPGPIRVADLLARLVAEKPEFRPYGHFDPGDKQPHGLIVWRKGQALSLDETLSPDDELEMIIMVAGG